MFPVICAVISFFVFSSMYILLRAVQEKPKCSIIITALTPYDIAKLLSEAESAKSNSVYIVTNTYDEKYFKYLEKHYFIREVLTVVDRDT